MTSIDYEAEYNNRARVPEHPVIIEGWARDASEYRSSAAGRFERLRYGTSDRQVIDLFRPAAMGDANAAIVLFIHGGYWQSFDCSFFSHLARGLNAHGIAVALPGYDLCPLVGVGDIVDQIRSACRLLGRQARRLIVTGHSAGGHLAACMLATDWRAIDPALPDDFVPAAYAISGLFDLKPLLGTYVNKALQLNDAEAERLSPLFWTPPAGRVLDAVVGGSESTEYRRQSRSIVEHWGAAGVTTRYEEIEEANHFTAIAPLADPESAMTQRIASLARI